MLVRINKVVDTSLEKVYLETRSEPFNKALNKGLVFGNSLLVAGMSGVGKSYFITQLINDLVNNVDVQKNILIFSTISPIKQKARLVSNTLKISYNSVFKKQLDEKGGYDEINTNEEEIKEQMIKQQELPIWFSDKESSINSLEELVNQFHQNEGGNTIVIIDDLYSLRKDNERDDFEFANNLAHLINRLRKQKILVIATCKLNDKIEQVERIVNYRFHYPTKSDIYMSSNLCWAFNDIFILNRPDLLGIVKYGEELKESTDLVHLKKVKTNEGKLGDIWFTNVLKKGHFEPLEQKKLFKI